METNKEDNKYIKAKHKVAQIKKFYSSLIFYFIFVGFLAALNYYVDHWRNPWFLWAAFGWGIGLFFQAMKVFSFNSLLGKDWEQRKLKQFMDEEEKHDQNHW